MFIDKAMCTGCGACSQVCARNALTMQYDEEGFLYPVKNDELCNQCGACIKVCHMKKEKPNKLFPLRLHAATLSKEEDLKQVSSGGVFWVLAKHIIKKGGIVYGVEQSSLYDVHHARAATLEQSKQFRRSKYLESHMGDSYINVKKDLKDGRLVLFTGTGCQVAGLYGFLGSHEYSNLTTCEVVCHGIPSMKVFQAYIQELESTTKKKVKNIVYRDKSKGWSKNCIRIVFTDGTSQVQLSGENPMHRGYLSGYYSRPSCSQCRYAQLPRVADITLADYWKYEGSLDSNRNMGVSLVVCSSNAGVEIIDRVKDRLLLEATELESAINSSRHLTKPPSESKYRKSFFREVNLNGFQRTYNKYRRREHLYNRISGRISLIQNHMKNRFKQF